MAKLLTAAQMRDIEQAAIRSGQVSGSELMERAGQGVFEAIFEEWPALRRPGASPSPSVARTDGANDGNCSPGYLGPDEGWAPRAGVFCGPGNNGGDGFVVARLLCEEGWKVEVFLYGDAKKLPPDALANYERWCAIGVVQAWSAPAIATLSGYDLYVDAIFGAGLTRAPAEEILGPLAQLYETGETLGRMVCIDAPSGLCMDSGRALSAGLGAVHGSLTVTFHRMRLGQFLRDGPKYCGALRVVDIGLSGAGRSNVRLVDPGQMDLPRKTGAEHKYSHGHALILTGGFGKTGAARLAARGALRIGAGLVTLGVPPSAQMEVASQITALMLRRVDGAKELQVILEDERLNAMCLGPGLGVERARMLVPTALSVQRSVVLDADALSAFADDPQVLFDQLHDCCVLTPHEGEFARLFPDISEKLHAVPDKGPAYSKADACREAANRAGCVVLIKGSDTVIAAPDGRCSINAALYERAAPWLATAGSGDVLAGFIAGMVARGAEPMEAAESAAWLHVECARQFGPGLIAEDLPEQLPSVFRQFGF